MKISTYDVRSLASTEEFMRQQEKKAPNCRRKEKDERFREGLYPKKNYIKKKILFTITLIKINVH